jgi:aspartate oxidase
MRVFSITIHAANRLIKNNINKEIVFSSDSFRFIANDRRLAQNTSENRSMYQDEVKRVLEDMYPKSKWEYEDVSNENERLAFTVNFNTNINIFN